MVSLSNFVAPLAERRASATSSPVSFTSSPACLTSALDSCIRPSASRSGLSVASPVAALALPASSSALLFALSAKPIRTSLVLSRQHLARQGHLVTQSLTPSQGL